jgi:hypothetical protein
MEFAKLLVPESAVKRLSIMDKEEVPCVPVLGEHALLISEFGVVDEMGLLEDHIERFKSIAADRTLRRSKSGNRNEVLIDFTMLKDLTRVILGASSERASEPLVPFVTHTNSPLRTIDMEQARRRTYQYTPEAPVENFLRQTFEKLPSDGDIVAKRYAARLSPSRSFFILIDASLRCYCSNVIFTEEQAQIDKSRNSQSSLLDQVNNAAKKFSFGIGNKD